MAGTVVVDAVKSSTTGAPTFQNTSGTEIGTLCRAWVNFNGQGTVAIRASFNVSSITDNGTGDYTVNFTNAIPDVNYAISISGVRALPIAGADDLRMQGGVSAYNTSSVRIKFGYTHTIGYDDSPAVNVAIFR